MIIILIGKSHNKLLHKRVVFGLSSYEVNILDATDVTISLCGRFCISGLFIRYNIPDQNAFKVVSISAAKAKTHTLSQVTVHLKKAEFHCMTFIRQTDVHINLSFEIYFYSC